MWYGLAQIWWGEGPWSAASLARPMVSRAADGADRLSGCALGREKAQVREVEH
jgi:hypothetical protein